MSDRGEQDSPGQLTDEQVSLRERMDALADRIRIPLLPEAAFVLGDRWVYDEQKDEEVLNLSDQDRANARLRRGALALAAIEVLDWIFDDLATYDFDAAPGNPSAYGDSYIYEAFPPRFRSAYNDHFARAIAATACKVVADLGDPEAGHAACLAEEMLRTQIADHAYELMADAKLGEEDMAPHFLDLQGELLEDADFENLYDADMDGFEEDTTTQASLGMFVLGVADWFTPFNPERYPHPYAETAQSGPRANTLPNLAGLLAENDSASNYAAAPAGSIAADSEVVTLGRAQARRDNNATVWIPDENDPEGSITALQEAMNTAHGSGWLTWEPHVGADRLAQDGTVAGGVQRHYPDPDVPFLHVSIGHRYLLIPVTSVVSWRPDPQVREQWNNLWSGLLGGSSNDEE